MNVRGLRVWLMAICVFCLPALAQAQGAWEDAPADGPTELEVQDSADFAADAEGDAEAALYPDRDPSALTDFNAELKPYGYWRDDPTYGTVWVPHASVVGKDFKPYVTNGHWAQDEAGEWIWVSSYPFGWVTFHYGRWVWIRGPGWSWIPGRQYANAWVVWRAPDPGVYYVGWAPMPPDYIWVNGYAVGVGFGVYTAWVFCPSAYMYDYHLHHHLVHDHHQVHYLGAHTHHYHAPGRARYVGPDAARARIPARAVPKKRVAANPKAVAASKPSGAAARRIAASARRSPTSGARPLPSSGVRRPPNSATRLDRVKSLGSNSGSGPTPRSSGATIPRPQRSYGTAAPQRFVAPRAGSAPQRRYVPSRSRASAPQRSAPSRSSSPQAQPRQAPSRSAAPQVRQAPPRAVQPSRPPAPARRSAPARSGGRRR